MGTSKSGMVEGTEGIRRNLFTQEQSKEKTGAA
jgi:hypothetical protein